MDSPPRTGGNQALNRFKAIANHAVAARRFSCKADFMLASFFFARPFGYSISFYFIGCPASMVAQPLITNVYCSFRLIDC
jgi:hypothetical protein